MDVRVRPILTRILRTGVPLEEVLRFALIDGRNAPDFAAGSTGIATSTATRPSIRLSARGSSSFPV